MRRLRKSERTESTGTRSTAYVSSRRAWSTLGSRPVGRVRRPSWSWIPPRWTSHNPYEAPAKECTTAGTPGPGSNHAHIEQTKRSRAGYANCPRQPISCSITLPQRATVPTTHGGGHAGLGRSLSSNERLA